MIYHSASFPLVSFVTSVLEQVSVVFYAVQLQKIAVECRFLYLYDLIVLLGVSPSTFLFWLRRELYIIEKNEELVNETRALHVHFVSGRV